MQSQIYAEIVSKIINTEKNCRWTTCLDLNLALSFNQRNPAIQK